eukprot:Opistho-2@76124
MPQTMVPSTPRFQKNQAMPAAAANSRASCQVVISAPWLITISGMTTAERAAIGAYCRPCWAQCGRLQGLLEMKKKPRVMTVMQPSSTMVSRVQGSRSSMVCTLPGARRPEFVEHQADRNRAGDRHEDVELEGQRPGRHRRGTGHAGGDDAQL